MVLHRVDDHARFLADLARDRVLQAFPGLDEAGDGRIPARRPGRLTAEQCALAIRDQHDDRRIQSRELLVPARGALHDVTALRGDHRRGAAAAEAIVLLPVDHGSRVGEQARLFGRQLARDQPQVVQLRAAAKRGRRFACEHDREHDMLVELAEQDEAARVEPRERLRARREVSRSHVRPTKPR